MSQSLEPDELRTIQHAADILASLAESLRECHTVGPAYEWDGSEPDAQEESEDYLRTSRALRALQERNAELERDARRKNAAIRLVWLLHNRQKVHLGLERLSGFDQGCIACVCALALGRSMDGDGGLTEKDYDDKYAALSQEPTRQGEE